MFLSPMLLQTSEAPFDSNEYIFELKNNGVRLLIENGPSKRNYYTRHGNLLNNLLPELDHIELTNCYLDGELVCFKNGKEDFEGVMSRINSKTKNAVAKGLEQHPLTYIVFDIIEHNQKNITDSPLLERKEILTELIEDTNHIRKSISVLHEGIHLFNQVKKLGLEGIVAKKLHSSYQIMSRSYDWLKIINWQYVECYITGYNKRRNAWILSFLNGEKAGVVEFGMNSTHKEAFYNIAKTLITGESSQYIFIKPIIKCKIKSRGRLQSGLLMTPVFEEFLF